MKLKSYFAATVEAAMSMARQELGPDAMLVVSRRAGADARHLGEYEVVFALVPEAGPEMPPSAAGLINHDTPGALRPLDRLSDQVAGLKHQMERLASAIARSHAAMARIASNPDAALAFSRLLEAEVDPEIAYEIVSRVCGQLQDEAAPSPNALTARLVEAELERLLPAAPALTSAAANSAIVLVGPPGSGKTTSLVKLAVRYGLGAKRPAQILTLDSQRVAAAEQLRSYAAILGIGFQIVDTPAALAQALEEHRNKQLILIDTPGLARRELDDGRDLAEFLRLHGTIQTHLVLSASMKPADMRRIACEYAMFLPCSLLFTHLDETSTFGPLLSLSLRLGKPISFLSFGQQIPEDLEPAESSAVARLIVKDAAPNSLAGAAKAA